MEQTALAKSNGNSQLAPVERIKGYLFSPEIKERFADMMGDGGIYYLNQVMIQVANNPKLQLCTPQSILIAAMRAASLRLSIDQGQGQAWIIPYGDKASFQLGYKGIYELAIRTNLYRFINVIDVYEGEVITENRMTGMHSLSGSPTDKTKIIGRMLYFQLLSGFEKTFYMTTEEIAEHAKTYSKSYGYSDSPWNANKGRERGKMERKTVLSNGLRMWGRFNASDKDTLDAIEADHEFIAPDELPDENDVTVIPEEKRSEKQAVSELGFDAPEEPDEVINYDPSSELEDPTEQPATASVEAYALDEQGHPYD
jgi:recombination protein RecT